MLGLEGRPDTYILNYPGTGGAWESWNQSGRGSWAFFLEVMMETQIKKIEGWSFTPKNLEEALKQAEIISNSGMVPDQYKGKPAAVLVALQMGNDIGLPGLQALQSIAVINGVPSVFGDGSLAVCMRHPDWKGKEESKLSDIRKAKAATCTVYRKNCKPVTQDFSLADAQAVGLWYPEPSQLAEEKKKKFFRSAWFRWWPRMLLWRARGFALRDQFADALKGVAIAEEQMDYADVKFEDATEGMTEIKNPEPLEFNQAPLIEEEDIDQSQADEQDQVKIEFDDKPDPDIEAATLGFISKEQSFLFKEYCADHELEGGVVYGWLKIHDVDAIDEIPADRFDDIFAELKRVTEGEK